MNIMGYYIRLTNGKVELLDNYVYREVHAFLDEVAAIFAERNPQLAALLPKSSPGEDDDAGAAGLKKRLKTGFRFFETHWDGFVRSTYDRVAEQNRLRALVEALAQRLDDDEPDAKRPRTEEK
jgi:serine phosphatase RsbU (regulator of sigma subunit)